MATTLLKEVTNKPLSLYNDGTYVYVATDKGRVERITISGGAYSVKAIINEQVNAITGDQTNLYVGLASGELKQVVISGGAVSILEIFDSAIISLGLNSTNLYVGLANGQIRLKDLS